MQLRVRQFSSEDERQWDEYASAHRLGSPFHEIGWKKAIETTYGYRPEYLLAEADGRVAGVLPLFLVESLLTGKVLLSTPFAVYGGILADTPEVLKVLADAAAARAEELGVQYLELRNAHAEQVAGFQPVTRYVTFLQKLAETDDGILAGIPRKTRRMVRKSLESGYQVERTRELGTFFDLYSRSLRRLGTPCFPRRHFTELLDRYGDRVDIREYRVEGKAIAAVLTFYYKDRLLPYYGASDPDYHVHAPNNYMYFELMSWGAREGYQWFDFGRSKKESGSYAFKAHWGMDEIPLPYEILLVKRREMPNFSPTNPRFELALHMWQRLPLAVTRLVGPHLIRLVP